jgi:hypothetical protein
VFAKSLIIFEIGADGVVVADGGGVETVRYFIDVVSLIDALLVLIWSVDVSFTEGECLTSPALPVATKISLP